ncbi:MAG: arylesterase [Acidobacteria bacterium]|jgi:acyl-CoA thioesterase-1|nr:arylesterase [Acidobacteriota bacterium]
MNRFIRGIAVLNFISSVLIFSACGVSTAETQTNKAVEKTLSMPQTNSDKPKIVAFGDSLTAGFGLTEKESYPYLLQQKLSADGFDYEVVNAGVSGETSLGGVERVDWVLEQENVSILILELGANDLLRRVPVAKMKENLSKIIERAQAKNITVLLCGMLAPPNAGAQYQRDYVSVFPDLASRYKVAFMPFILEGVALNPQLNQPDGIHPNSEGEKIMTDNVYKALKPLLQQRQR